MLVRVVCHALAPSGGAICGAADAALCVPADVWAVLHPDNRCPDCVKLSPPDKSLHPAAVAARKRLN